MTHRLMLPMLAASAVALGFGGRCLWRSGADDRAVAPVAEDRPERSLPSAPTGTGTVSRVHSIETLASLMAVTDGTLYGRLALWLLDASEADVAAYWKFYGKLEPHEFAIVRLVFIQWTRLNPRAAITAVAGTDDEATAWWAWACHDPAGALAAAIADNPARVADVANGIGEFHPAWLRAHFDDIPAAERSDAMSAMACGEVTVPLETLEFLRQHGSPCSPEALAALIRKDPWAAYDWVRENVVTARYSNTAEMLELFVKSLAEEHPDELRRLAKQAPSGGLKLQLETAAFDLLLKSDPAAALAEAKANSVPRIAAQRLAAVGNSLVKTDPEQAFALARELFAVCPDALYQMDLIYYGNRASGGGDLIQGLNGLLDGLMDQDPARAMELHTLVSKGPSEGAAYWTIRALAQTWAARDLPAFGEWVNEQSDPAIRDAGGSVMISQLINQKQFEPALKWAEGLQDARVTQLYNVIFAWQDTDPAAAGKWLDASDLTEKDKTHRRQAIRTKP